MPKRRAQLVDADTDATADLPQARARKQQRRAERPAPRVALLVPFRDLDARQRRAEHLARFVPFMTHFLRRHCAATFHVFVLEQTDDGRKFNRGKLLNAGFDLARDDYDVFVFHDVDLLPDDELGALYAAEPLAGPMHIARVWGRYNENPHYFGGVVAFTRAHFLRVNGFPNTFWGWGGEDNELYTRVMRSRLQVHAPPSGTITDLENLDLPSKLAALRASDCKCHIKRQLLKEHRHSWRANGLASLRYEVVDAVALDDTCTRIQIELGLNGHWSDDHAGLRPPPKQPATSSGGDEEPSAEATSAAPASANVNATM